VRYVKLKIPNSPRSLSFVEPRAKMLKMMVIIVTIGYECLVMWGQQKKGRVLEGREDGNMICMQTT
jgi:hypothetical protein